MISIFTQGFSVGAGLIIAIGAQNTFVLSQGVKKQHYLLIPLICALCDFLLIMIGVAGVGSIVASSTALRTLMAYGGAIFLTCYGVTALLDSIKGSQKGTVENGKSRGRREVLITVLGLTFLNPHVYLDTIVLMGSISGQFDGVGRYVFGLGATLASTLWFFSLSILGTAIAPLFKVEITWRVLNLIVAATMFTIAYQLIR